MKPVQISFCLPVYNVEEYVSSCIDGIMSFCDKNEINYEIVCVDDCSTDKSFEKLQEYQNKSSVKCVKNAENLGVSATRNIAMSIAQGEYIWFVDPDDLVNVEIIPTFLKVAEDTNADVILGNYKRFYDFKVPDYCKPTRDSYVTSDRLLLPGDDSGVKMCSVCVGILKKSFLNKNNLKFNENMIAQEDTLFYYEMEQCFPMAVKMDDICYFYRQRHSSVMHTHSEERQKKYYRAMRTMLDVYEYYYANNLYRDKDILLDKIHHSKENIAMCLALCTDNKFVRSELKEIKRLKIYPYAFRKKSTHYGNVFGLMTFLLPIPICFHISHYCFYMVNRIRYFKNKKRVS